MDYEEYFEKILRELYKDALQHSLLSPTPKPQMAVSQNWGYLFWGGPNNKDYNILGSRLGSPNFRKLPNLSTPATQTQPQAQEPGDPFLGRDSRGRPFSCLPVKETSCCATSGHTHTLTETSTEMRTYQLPRCTNARKTWGPYTNRQP